MSNSYQSIFDAQKKRSIELRPEEIKDRKARLKKLKTWILNNRRAIHEALHLDLKKSATDTDVTEVFTVTTSLNKAIANIYKWSKPTRVSPGLTYLGTKGRVKPEPKGVCLIIAPWNYPFNLVASPLVYCLAAGNTAILKPSEHTPATSKLIKKMAEECFDPSEVAVVEGAIEETTSLLKLPFDHIFFTGSTGVGKIIMEAASKNLTSVTLELGGKSPVIIDATSDVNDAAKKVMWGKFTNNGQTCIAPDYVLIDEKVKADFITACKKYIGELFDPESKGLEYSEEYSRMVNENHSKRVVGLLDDAITNGASVEIGAKSNSNKRFIEPTLISNISEDSKIWQEEIFGPVLPMNVYSDLDKVIDHINSNPKPLALYLFSRSKKIMKKVLNATSSGAAVINDVVLHYSHPNLPFGGVNHSGIGKSHGYYGFKEFSNEKAVLKQRVGLTNASVFYPPFNGFKKKVVDLMIKYF